MILTNLEIVKQVKKGNIKISPFKKSLLNPNSYNYRLAETLLEFDDIIDAKKKSNYKTIQLTDEGYVLQPNKLYLGSTYEKIGSDKYVIQLIGRSSMGRLGLFLQVTAPLGHVGTYHSWTLELKVVQPLRVYPFMKIGQVTFWKIKGKKDKTYKNGEYRQFEKAQVSKFYKELNDDFNRN